MSPTRIQIGRDVVVVDERPDGLQLEGPRRLRPGGTIEIAPSCTSLHLAGCRLVVRSWTVWRLGRGRPVYRGNCGWLADRREPGTRGP